MNVIYTACSDSLGDAYMCASVLLTGPPTTDVTGFVQLHTPGSPWHANTKTDDVTDTVSITNQREKNQTLDM